MLQRCEALRFIKVLESGRTKPLIIECECADDENYRTLQVVKAFNLPEVHEIGLYCELLGNLLARELGVETPRPALINLSEDFVAVTNQVLRRYGLNLRPGLGVGCEYLGEGFTSPVAGILLSPDEKAQAALIYAFDKLVQNPDRRDGNPNCAVKNGKFVAFDFNLAFTFLLLIGSQGEPWEFSKHRTEYEHIFLRSLRGREVGWQPFVDVVGQLTEDRIEELCGLVPIEWGNWNEKICAHLMSVVENKDKLIFELERSLS